MEWRVQISICKSDNIKLKDLTHNRDRIKQRLLYMKIAYTVDRKKRNSCKVKTVFISIFY